jgi:hypothetical protein
MSPKVYFLSAANRSVFYKGEEKNRNKFIALLVKSHRGGVGYCSKRIRESYGFV